MTEREILAALAKAHPAPAWAFLEHVADGTGRHKLRTSDAMAMSLWPSRGLELHGFEVKSHRADWLRELKAPAKADELVGRCHRWWVVAGDADVVRLEEVPATWGLRVGPDLVVSKEAPLLTPAEPDFVFLAAVLRRAAEAWSHVEMRGKKAAAFEAVITTALDPVKTRARLERLKSTGYRIARDIDQALYQLDHNEKMAARGVARVAGGTRGPKEDAS